VVTVEEVLYSRMIADPLTILSCNPLGDGAAAAVLASKEVAATYTSKPVWVAASVLTTGCYDLDRDITRNQPEERAGKQAFEMAGIGPTDFDLAEVHDCFTIAEFMRVESLGLVPEGEYGKWLDEGLAEIGGRLPINPSGGLLSKGHPVGATGVAQIAEVTWHLRGEAEERQVQGAKVGMTHCSGGGVAGDTAACCVHILKI
jgi:acetyl-CoA acetyltransferase